MSSSKLMGILAIVAVVLIGTLIVLQVAEINGYKAEPSVWPASK